MSPLGTVVVDERLGGIDGDGREFQSGAARGEKKEVMSEWV